MGPIRRGCLLVLSVLLVMGQAAVTPAQEEPRGGKVLIGFKADKVPATPRGRAEIVRRLGGMVHGAFQVVPVVAANVPEHAMARLKTREDIAYIEEDVVLYAAGQTTPWGVDRIDADLAWPNGNRGKGVRVAVLDTGIDFDHPDLRVAGGVNFAGTSRDGRTSRYDWNDTFGHGTHVAGIIAARNNKIGVVGVAPDVSLWAVKVLGDGGSGYTSDVIQGLDWCVTNGVRVASMSFGGAGSKSLRSACDRAYARGVLLVAAAGNERGAVSYPAAYPSVIAVSATDSRNNLAFWSNSGPEIELAAPGVSIYSTYRGGRYATMSGTSMGCPHAAGAAALAWASGLTSSTAVRARLTATAEDLGVRGLDSRFGYGLVDAQRAAARIASVTPPETPGEEDSAPPSAPDTSQATTVSVDLITYSTAGGAAGDRDLVITLHLRDNLGDSVSNALVLIGLSLDARLYCVLSGGSGADGAVTFTVPGALPGLYETRVAQVQIDGLAWDGVTVPNQFTR
jgi:subtilisin family serine protease